MSRIGKKPIPIPKGVTVKIEGHTVAVQGPKGKLDTALPNGITIQQKDGIIVAVRENDSQAALHGLARALVNFDRSQRYVHRSFHARRARGFDPDSENG